MTKRIISRMDFYTICGTLDGMDLIQYGIPFRTMASRLTDEYVDEILAAVENDPKLHIVSMNKDDFGVNYYKENCDYYYLCDGDADPNIEVSPLVENQIVYTEEELQKEREFVRKALEEAPNSMEWQVVLNLMAQHASKVNPKHLKKQKI